MIQSGASDKSEIKRIGRLRAAWLVLMGQRVTPQQIMADWAEYQFIFNDLLERWSAKLAREAKAEKKRIARLEPDTVPPVALPPQNPKAALRRKMASMRGLQALHAPVLEEAPSEPSA